MKISIRVGGKFINLNKLKNVVMAVGGTTLYFNDGKSEVFWRSKFAPEEQTQEMKEYLDEEELLVRFFFSKVRGISPAGSNNPLWVNEGEVVDLRDFYCQNNRD